MTREEAIEIVRLTCPRIVDSDCDFETAIRTLVPELQESNEEKVKKVLIDYFENYKTQEKVGIKTFFGIPTDDILSWLKKQGIQTPHKYNTGDWIISKYGGIYQIKEVMKDNYTLLSTNNIEEINSINIVDNNSRPLTVSDIQKLEKQNYEFNGIAEPRPAKGTLKKLIDDIEKPKFKVGDWVMLDRPVLITKVEDMPYNTHQYWTSDGTWFGDATKAKLWTIQDARDGDILVANIHHWEIGGNVEEFPVRVPTIFIYQETKTDNKNIHAYVSLFNNTTLDIYKSMYYIDDFGIKDIRPATKEQKELILNKIRESGWSWDAETKELSRLK